ncbi:Crp/Fnr family transcriptional regulator [Variovorax sp. H27-G14]|uniref:Crp/Fnr family transcriptional regulator n=1 Tax=Variovorax sp. H27-G14 TaxID=3111914 RepID=UPI0038FC67EB
MYLHPLIAQLPQKERVALVQRSELRSYRRNETLLTANEWSNHVYCVASGPLRVVAPPVPGGGADVTTDFIHQDDFFLSPAFNEDSFQATQTLIAALPSSVYLVPISAMRNLCAAYPSVALCLLGMALKRMASMRGQLQRISSLSSEDLVTRVLRQLTYLAPAGTGSSGYDKRITQSVIASYSGLSREVVNKTMRDLESRGLVRREEDGVHVSAEFASTDFTSLQAMAL